MIPGKDRCYAIEGIAQAPDKLQDSQKHAYYVMHRYFLRDRPFIQFFNNRQLAWQYVEETQHIFRWRDKGTKWFAPKDKFTPLKVYTKCEYESWESFGELWFIEMGPVVAQAKAEEQAK